MTITTPSFISLQVRDLERAASFYESVGFTRAPMSPPGAVVFASTPAFAVREVLPDVDLDSVDRPGLGVALWFGCSDVEALDVALVDTGATILTPPFDGPFGRTLVFADPDGYAITVHQQR